MKKNILIGSLLIMSLLLMTSCNKDNGGDDEANSFTITGVIEKGGDNIETRTGIVEDADFTGGGESYYWVDGDLVKLLFYEGGNLTNEPITRVYKAVVQSGKSNSCSFTPNEAADAVAVPEGDYTVYALYPANGWVKSGASYTVSMPAGNVFEKAANTTSEVGPYMFTRAITPGVTIGNGKVTISLTFFPMTSLLRFIVNDNINSTAVYKSLVLTSSKAVFPTSASLSSIDASALTPDDQSLTSSITVDIEAAFQSSNSGRVDIYIPILPTGDVFQGTDKLSIAVTGTDNAKFTYGPYDISAKFDYLRALEGFQAGNAHYISMRTGSKNNITGAAIDKTSLPAYESTDVTFSIAGTYPANTVKVRVWNNTSSTILVAETAITESQSASTGTKTVSVPANASWSSRDLVFQYYHPVTQVWTDIRTITQAGYDITAASATAVTKKAGGNSTVSLTGYRPLTNVRAITGTDTELATGTVAAATSGEGTGTLAIPANATATARVITIQWSDGRSWTDITSFTQSHTIATEFARSNIVWDATNNKLTFAVTAEDNATISANVQGVFFQWGSLVAISPAALTGTTQTYTAGQYPAGHIVYSPTGTYTYAWASIPYISSTDAPFDNSTATEDDFATYNSGQGWDNTGRGDICRYITSQGWVSGNWRLPTADEYDQLMKEQTSISNGGAFTDIYVSPAVTTNHYGYYQPLSGRWLGMGIATGGSETAPPVGVYFPAAGHRTSLGRANGLENNGKYWPGSSRGGTPNGTCLSVDSGFALRMSMSRQSAFSVRCVRE